MATKMTIEQLEELRKARFMLYIHNLITESQNDMILKKTDKLIKKHGYVKEDRKELPKI